MNNVSTNHLSDLLTNTGFHGSTDRYNEIINNLVKGLFKFANTNPILAVMLVLLIVILYDILESSQSPTHVYY